MENLDRITKINHFVTHTAKISHFRLEPLTVDASSRKYYRIFLDDGHTFIVMDDEGCRWKTHEFVELSKFLRTRGVYVPEVFISDFNDGFLLLEDLGDETITKALRHGDETTLYKLAAEAIIKVAAINERPECVKELSRNFLVNDVCLFSDWYFPMTTDYPLPDSKRQEFIAIMTRVAEMAFRVPSRLVLWDYHIDNIMLPPQSKECAIIDFQDAMWGPLTYDIMSLLAADRHTATAQTIREAKELFFSSLKNIRREDFEDSFAALSAFRHLRVLGRFTTLSMVKQKERYLQYIPQIWQMLEEVLQYPKLAPLKQWLDNNLPQNQRGLPHRKPLNHAMVLAAGRGTRMKELTDELPKPLIKVGGRSLIDYNFDRIKEINIKDVVVNLCYKGDMIKEHLLKTHPDVNIKFSIEEEALETGGGIKKALPLLKDSQFFVFNSDVFFIEEGFKPVLWKMMDAWDADKYDILILLQDLEQICGDRGIGDYRIDTNGNPERNAAKTEGFTHMFGGISIVSSQIVQNEPREKFSLRDLFDIAQSKGRLGFVLNDAEFFHVGTPEALEAANIKINKQR